MLFKGYDKFLSIILLLIGIQIICNTTTLYSQNRFLTFAKGDAIRIKVWQPWRMAEGNAGIEDLNGDYAIDNQGNILLPLISEVKVVGHSIQSLSDLIKEKLIPFLKDPFVLITPLIRVTVQGAINRPGAYLIPPTASLWEMIETAGGPTEKSQLKNMFTERGGRVAIKNLLRSFESGYSLQDIGIRTGDQIIVPSKSQFSYRDVLGFITFGMNVTLLYLRITE